MTYYFYNNLKLINTVNKHYNHIVELEELHRTYSAAANSNNYWKDKAGIEYIALERISFHTYWNHYSNKKLEWDVETILAKLEGKTRDEIEAINITTIIPNL